MESLFINDNYFKAFPKKILGEAYETSGRFGKVTKYKGTIADVDRIDAPSYTPEPYGEGIAQSVENIPTKGSSLSDSDIQNIEKAILKAGPERTKLRAASNPDSKGEVFTFDEVDAQYNSHISESEKIAFVWYMRIGLGRKMEGGWKKYHRILSKSELSDMVKEGVLMYEKGKLVPAFIYFSGNVYQKFVELEKEKQAIVKEFSQAAYDAQYLHLKVLKDEMYKRRLILDAPNPDERLKILPTSEFAKTYKIKFLKDEVEIKANILSKGIAWKNDVERNFTTIKEPTLQEAFIYWLKNNARKIAFKYGLDWASVYDLGVYDKKYVKDGGLDYDDTAEKEEFKKKKSKAKMEAKRLFSDFLANEIDLNDKVRIETQWNQQYNANYQLDLNRVPIGFTMAKQYGGLDMDIRPEKREAIAFAMMEGSGCLAYGVGLGKTWCAIFIFAQFIENGWALRPLLAVPNQVYKQFMNEIKGILPHVAVNDFYNLSDKYLDNVPKDTKYVADQKDYDGIFLNGKPVKSLDSEKEKYENYLKFLEEANEADRRLQVYPVPNDSEGKYFRIFNQWHFIFDAKKVKNTEGYSSVPMKSISMVTYEGLRRIGIDESEESEFFNVLNDIMAQNNENSHEQSQKKQAKANERFNAKLKSKIGKGQIGTEITIQTLGIDMLTVDEAHSMKKVFTEVKGEGAEEGKQNKKAYKITSGTPSVLAIKGFMLSQYIQHKNPTGNVLILTATPFTNSPLEVYSMLSLIGFNYLKKEMRLANLQDFFDTFVEVRYELVIDAKLKPTMKEIFVGFNNLPGLQGLIKKFFLYKLSVKNQKRPNKIVLPLRQRSVNGNLLELDENERIDTILEMSPLQREHMDFILAYAEGKVGDAELGEIIAGDGEENEDDNKITAKKDDESDIKESALTEKEKSSVRLLKAMAWSRSVALSPYLYKNTGGLYYKSYIETSAKLDYTMRCVRSVKEYHEAKGEPVSGQVIYMNRGVQYFDYIKDYLIREVGYKEHEIGIIRSKMTAGKDKAWVQDRFLGREWNEAKREHESIPDSQRIKIIIGSATIKEGLNLQKYGTVLYNLFLDWNPTDVIQLEGRIWRQGNLWENIRIVTPLLEDSMDIFMFQKLEEKTRRINAIWDYDGNAKTLNVEEYNPAELKYELIKDPNRVAQLENQEIKERLDDELSVFVADIATLNDFTILKRSIDNFIANKYSWIKFWREVDDIETYKENPLKFQNLVTKILTDGLMKDGSRVVDVEDLNKADYSNGLHIPSTFQKTRWGGNDRVKSGVAKIVEPSEYNFSWKNFKDAVRKFTRTNNEILKPKGINPNANNATTRLNDENGYHNDNGVKYTLVADDPFSVAAYIIKIEDKINESKQRVKEMTSEEAISKRAAEITQQRIDSNVASATVADRVKDFEKLNYLLSLRKFDEKPKVSIPVSISKESLREIPISDPKLGMNELIGSLQLSVKYLLGKEKEEMSELIKGLETSLKYL